VPSAFNFAASPFDALQADERQLVRRSVDIEYFRAGATILAPGTEPTHLFVVIKGHVHQWDGDEQQGSFGPDDCFDGRGLVAGRVSSRFVASEEVVLYRLARSTVMTLIAGNATFGALLFADLSNKLGALAERRSQHELQSLTMARVDQAYLRAVHFVDADDDVARVARVFHEQRTTNVLVRDTATTPSRLGIFTVTSLPKAIMSGVPLDQLPVRAMANFKLVTIRPSTPLFDALALMIRHRIHRLVVAEGEQILGFLQQLDLLSYLSNHSYLITLQILEANDIATLKTAAEQITRLIGVLEHSGTKVGMIARLVQELNATLFERAWQLIAPEDLIANSCLFVMGSEGRGEQLLKTDQDNGLILRNGYECLHDLDRLCSRFSAALAEFGYPPCPGNIMVSNPDWRHSEEEFASTVRGWLFAPTPDHLMSLAIFLDAHCVAGDAALLARVRDDLWRYATNNAGTLGRFAGAIDAFQTDGGWWNRILHLGDAGKEQLDLKKAGIFPLVHGVRSLAFEHRIAATSTVERIEALLAEGHLPVDFGTDLVDSLHFFMGLKLRTGLQAMEQGRPAGSGIALDKLGSLDRDLLKDTLAVVKRFKAHLRLHFHLDVI
jgi:CBS domain-containing protein